MPRPGCPASPTDSFDLVLASNVIEHLEPDAAAALLGDIVRLLRLAAG